MLSTDEMTLRLWQEEVARLTTQRDVLDKRIDWLSNLIFRKTQFLQEDAKTV